MFIVSSRTARAIEREPVSNKQTNKQKPKLISPDQQECLTTELRNPVLEESPAINQN